MKPKTVLSLEQALSMTYATLRFVHQGWRVIRLEATPSGNSSQPGDPNRYIGKEIAEPDRHAYYVAPNVGKEAIALNLKSEEGKEALKCIIQELDVDVFCCNTIPTRYETLGIDYETLCAVKPDLIWAGISAMGPDYPDVAGYDPMIQAMSGYMELTGYHDGPPTISGIPLVDLKAGDEIYAGVLAAMVERLESGKGKRIDVSMLQAAASWLITTLPLIDMDCEPEEITRWGNAHRKFIPSNIYPTSRGFIYVAMGSNAQWNRFCATEMFSSLGAGGRRNTAEIRYKERKSIYREIGKITSRHTGSEISNVLNTAKVPNNRINNVQDVHNLEAIKRKSTTTNLPNGQEVQMQPMATDIENAPAHFPMAPRYGEHSLAILEEAGYSQQQRSAMLNKGIIAVPNNVEVT
ncbi:MAG: CoA transferase [Rhodospirillaceae bacterium]|jgi:itaconate CoA-transferase|nr:CoA transferase [Rhodospirillaceae bacterium]MBT5939423.1 CoA transferase [Rhodospirillaceae bacterium]MBT7266644.1 CoA transferase [Rhodospirillaceae bacterium]